MALTLPPDLVNLLGDGAIATQNELGGLAIDGVSPGAALQPASREAVAEVLKWATGQGLSVFPRGGGTHLAVGNVASNIDLVLDTRRLDRLLDYQPDDLTATVEAGITLDQLQKRLATGGKFLPLESPLAQLSTIGGILAANVSGPLRHAYRQPRDWLIGISVVDAAGIETKAGGKVVKNVTGYDLNKLYTGSMGTLGVIVEATFKLTPLPADRGALGARFPSMPLGLAASRGLLGQVYSPLAVQVVNPQAAGRIVANPVATLAGEMAGDEVLVLAFFSGRSQAMKRRVDDCSRALRDSGARDLANLDESETARLLGALSDLGWGPGANEGSPYLSIKITAPPAAVGQVVDRCGQESSLGHRPAVTADPGFGLVRLSWWPSSTLEAPDVTRVLDTISKTLVAAREAGGYALVEHCPLAVKQHIDVWGESPDGLEIMRSIKQKFDPNGTLSPGRFVGGI